MEGHSKTASGDSMDIEASPQQNADKVKGPTAEHDGEAAGSQRRVTRNRPASLDTSSRSNSLNAAEVPSSSSDADLQVNLSLDEQIQRVRQIADQPLEHGQAGFVVAISWLERVLARGADADPKEFSKTASEGDIGRVDNQHLISTDHNVPLVDECDRPFVQLRRDVRVSEDFEILPQEGWEMIAKLYGVMDGSEIRRYVHKTNDAEASVDNLQYELYPPIFTIRKLRNDSAGLSTALLRESSQPAPSILASRHTQAQSFLKQAKEAVGVDNASKVRLWRIVETIAAKSTNESENRRPGGMPTPISSRNPSPGPDRKSKMLMDLKEFSEVSGDSQRELIDLRDETSNEKYNGKSNLDFYGLAADAVLIIDESTSLGDYISDAAPDKGSSKNLSAASRSNLTGKGVTLQQRSSAGDDDTRSSGVMTRGRTRKDGRVRGTVGLTNLGNTCYMNSALQCIRSCEELTLYFLQGKYKGEINSSNVLGHKGSFAKSYAALLAGIYDEGNMSSFTPKAFKNNLGRLYPIFSGYGQQDSQEFLSFLVDGLHEDLNRILKKPYIEYPESDGSTVGNSEAIIALGNKFREIHRARNDSVAMDLFSGFYKNTMVCPLCDNVSITFDPFSLLTLQIPVEQTWQHTVQFVPRSGRPINVEVEVNKNQAVTSIRDYISKLIPGLSIDHMVVLEIYSNRIYKLFDDHTPLSEANINSRDEIVVYELEAAPTNLQASRKQAARSMLLEEDDSDPDLAASEKMAVPIFHRTYNSPSSTGKKLVLRPRLMILTREEAKDYDTILRKVLLEVNGMTTRELNVDEQSPFAALASAENSDTVVTTEDDASSNLEPEVQAQSVQGEDSIVDVSMSETADASDDRVADNDSSQQATQTASPRHERYINPALRELFSMKIVADGRSKFTTGWSAVSDHKEHLEIESRLPQQAPGRRSSGSSQGSNQSTSASSDGGEDSIAASASYTPTLFPGDAESEDDFSHTQAHDFRSRRGGRNNGKKGGRGSRKKVSTYSRKQKHAQKAPHRVARQPSPIESDEDAGLVRLGEGILLDWTYDSFNALFGGYESDEYRGTDTWKSRETLENPRLQSKRATRENRRNNGITLEECFDETAKAEILSEKNLWRCNKCKEWVKASKTLEIWTAPDILVVHLKRFSANRRLSDKVDVFIDFPVEGLDLSSRVGLDEDKSLTYDLFAVDNHYGGLGGGHYTAYAKNFYDEQWYEYNDSSVSKRNSKSVVSPAAYLLFYRRRQPRHLGPPALQEIVREAYAPKQSGKGKLGLPDSDSVSSSRATSPSGLGNGSRLDDSYHGSSATSAAVGAAAARRQRKGEASSGGGTRARNASRIRLEDEEDEEKMEEDGDGDELMITPILGSRPPIYSKGFEEDDEEEPIETADQHMASGGSLPWTAPGWGFTSVNNSNKRDDTSERRASEAAATGSNDGSDELRMGLDDEGTPGLAPGQVSPEHGSNDDDIDAGGLKGMGSGIMDVDEDGDDGPVAEVRVGKDDFKID